MPPPLAWQLHPPILCAPPVTWHETSDGPEPGPKRAFTHVNAENGGNGLLQPAW